MEINYKKLIFSVDLKNHQIFWNDFLNWEKDDLDFVIENGEQDEIFIDIGAWIGPYTLIAARMGMKVYALASPNNILVFSLKNNGFSTPA